MNVRCAKKHIESIEQIFNAAVAFIERHEELNEETAFIGDAVAYLGDYKKILERLIDEAELKI